MASGSSNCCYLVFVDAWCMIVDTVWYMMQLMVWNQLLSSELVQRLFVYLVKNYQIYGNYWPAELVWGVCLLWFESYLDRSLWCVRLSNSLENLTRDNYFRFALSLWPSLNFKSTPRDWTPRRDKLWIGNAHRFSTKKLLLTAAHLASFLSFLISICT